MRAWLAPAASFLGAGLAYVGARFGTRQRENQGRREEWGAAFHQRVGRDQE